MYRQVLLVVCCFFYGSGRLHSQVFNDSIFSKEQMQQDFAILRDALYQNHPGVFKYSSRQKLDSVYEACQGLMDTVMNDRQYRMVLRGFVSQIGCGHTNVMASKSAQRKFQARKHHLLPFDVAVVDRKLYIVTNNSSDSSIVPGSEILEIDSNKMNLLLDEMLSRQSTDAGLFHSACYSLALTFSSWYATLYGERDTYNFLLKDTLGHIRLYRLANAVRKKLQVPPGKPVTLFDQPAASFRIINQSDTSLAIMKLSAFVIRNDKRFYKEAFKQIEKKGIKNLVIDLRGNGGGRIFQATALLEYLAADTFSLSFQKGTQGLTYNQYALGKSSFYITQFMFGFVKKIKTDSSKLYFFDFKPVKKHRFAGKLLVLTDAGTFSAASLLAAYAKYKCHATLLGSETGGTASGCFAVLMPPIELPGTKTLVRIPHYHMIHNLTTTEHNRGVLPNQEINRLPWSTNDNVMEQVYKIILNH